MEITAVANTKGVQCYISLREGGIGRESTVPAGISWVLPWSSQQRPCLRPSNERAALPSVRNQIFFHRWKSDKIPTKASGECPTCSLCTFFITLLSQNALMLGKKSRIRLRVVYGNLLGKRSENTVQGVSGEYTVLFTLVSRPSWPVLTW